MHKILINKIIKMIKEVHRKKKVHNPLKINVLDNKIK